MAASTLHTLLIKLGFDTSSLGPGVNLIRSELDRLQASVSKTSAAFVPATTAINNFAIAADRVAGSVQSPQAMNNMATSVKFLTNNLKGSQAAMEGVVNSYAILMREVGASSRQGSSIATVSKAVQTVTTALGGSTPAVRAWLNEIRQMATATAAADPAKFNLMVEESARHLLQASTAGQTFNNMLAQMAKMQIVNNTVAAQVAAQRSAAYQSWMVQQMKMQIINNSATYSQQQSIRAANALGAALGWIPGPANAAAAGLTRASGAARQFAADAGNAANRASFMNRVLSMAFAFSGGVAVTNVMSFVGNALLGFNSKIQQAQIAFTNFLGSAEKADAFIAKMEEFANVTPFEFEGLTENVQKMIAMGFHADQALPALRAIGDAVAGLGGSQDKLDRIAIALGQIMTAGRVTSQDMRQLTEAGIPAWQMLADAIGETQAQTRKLAEAGLIPANKALAALLAGFEERYGGMMEKQARTAQGAFSTVRDIVIQTIAGAVKPMFDLLTDAMRGLADFLVGGGGRFIAPTIWAIGIALAVGAIPHIYGAATAIGTLTVAMGGLKVHILPLIVAINMIGIAWQTNFMGIRDIVGPIITFLGGAIGWLAQATKGLEPIIQALAILITTRFVVSLIASSAAMVWNAATALILGKALKGLTIETVGATVATGGLAVAGRGAGGILGTVAAVLGGAVVGTIVLVAAAIALLVLKFNEVTQGLRVVYWAFLQVEMGLANFLTSIPLVGQGFTWLKDHVQSEMNSLASEMAIVQGKIDAAAKAANESAPGGDIFSEMDAAMAKMIADLQASVLEVQTTGEGLVKAFGTSVEGVREAAATAGADAMYEMARAIRDKQNAPLDAFKELFTMMQTQMTPEIEIARTYGMLTSTQLAQGLASGDAAVVAWAEALKKNLIARLDELTGNAYSAGLGISQAFSAGMMDPSGAEWQLVLGDRMAQFLNEEKANEWKNKWAPSADAVADAMAQINKELEEMAANSEAVSALDSAFRDIASAARDFFREQHQDILDAISDQLKYKNAILDAKAALNQAPVTAAQNALDARRAQIEEWRLREAIRTASSPEAYRDAVLALQDFLAQQHINQMQSEVDAANEKIDAQKAANEAQAEAQREAEQRRYEQMQRDFERQLELLQEYLAKHPGEWQKVEEQIIGLLRGYGFSYSEAGKLLGNSFVQGLREKIKDAVQAARDLAAATAAALSAAGGGSGGAGAWSGTLAAIQAAELRDNKDYNRNGIIGLETGAWSILKDNLLAVLHKDEMVAPADIAPLLRSLGNRRIDRGSDEGGSFATVAVNNSVGQQATPRLAPQTIIFQVGDQKLGEITDMALAREADVYGGRTKVTTRSLR